MAIGCQSIDSPICVSLKTWTQTSASCPRVELNTRNTNTSQAELQQVAIPAGQLALFSLQPVKVFGCAWLFFKTVFTRFLFYVQRFFTCVCFFVVTLSAKDLVCCLQIWGQARVKSLVSVSWKQIQSGLVQSNDPVWLLSRYIYFNIMSTSSCIR